MKKTSVKSIILAFFWLILYIIFCSVFAYIKTDYIEAAYYRFENSVLNALFMPVSVIVPLGLLFCKFNYDCKLNDKKTSYVVVNILIFIVCIWGYIIWGMHHPEFIYYILYLATEELMVVIFCTCNKMELEVNVRGKCQ